MSKDFDLIKEINHISENGKNMDKEIKNNIKYQQYELVVEDKPQNILIPVRECELFEKTLNDYDSINKVQLKKILHEHRGFRKRD